MKRKASSFALSVFFLCSLLFLPPVSSVNPGYGDYSIQTAALSDPPSALNFSSQGFFITGGSGCDDGGSWSGGGSKYICDYETKSQLYSYSWYTRFTPLLYNDTILLLTGNKGGQILESRIKFLASTRKHGRPNSQLMLHGMMDGWLTPWSSLLTKNISPSLGAIVCKFGICRQCQMTNYSPIIKGHPAPTVLD